MLEGTPPPINCGTVNVVGAAACADTELEYTVVEVPAVL